MAPGEIQAEVVQRQLQRVLESPGFARNERMSRFLRFIVEQQLSGRESDLKESLIDALRDGLPTRHRPWPEALQALTGPAGDGRYRDSGPFRDTEEVAG